VAARPGFRVAPRVAVLQDLVSERDMSQDHETGWQDARRSRVRRGARVCLIATSVLAFGGLVLASSVGDQTPPYEPSLINELAWTLFLVFGVASVLLGVIFFVWVVVDENRSHRALQGKVAEVAELQASRGRLVDESDAIRRRIERDLHDGVQARLVALMLNIGLARRQAGPDSIGGILEQVEDELRSILREVRGVAHGVLPPALTDLGLEAAVTELTASMPFRVEVAVPSQRLPERVEVTTYFLIAESLTNAVKHARASRVKVDVDVTGARAVVDISDDGIGGANATGGSGLRGLADRVDAVGGRLAVTSRDGAGTRAR
jgi:signal transduction histidine kinase